MGVVLVCLITLPAHAVLQPSTRPTAPKVLNLRLASYNILSAKFADKAFQNIQSVHPDIVLLQEAPLSRIKSFARNLGMSYQFGPYGPKSSTGLGILTIGKIKPVKLFDMPKERNFALAASVEMGNQKFLVICVHLKSLPRPLLTGLLKSMRPRQEQAKMIVELVKQTKTPAIVGGDFNTLSFTPEFLTLSSILRDCASAVGTSSQPSIFVNGIGYRIDHIFVRGPWKTRASQVSPLPGSDHRLIWVDLQLPMNGKASHPH
ncbi:MAG: endonuclease/exonuclease/phosphatase family protein [Phycisphaerae bacterium]